MTLFAKVAVIFSVVFNLILVVFLFLTIDLKMDNSKSLNPNEFKLFGFGLFGITIFNIFLVTKFFKKHKI